ncbi:golgin subfamily A member 4-like [Cataglyphis hispanica]|uniref:golgin subfamily A member 4-like n=1 Tax=Cataglyphis hispanica TaxID=1086592 RepID=UPI00217F5853|nr:golgin subfamily A member 4-like [Cataglyphis hispanica]XP_050447409.1 golgin subfamily A member 4-like [Cataglyphis hispanica]XP_050447410.1 golgin subfamily A member 4-like [Cataglyphis hispanica]
MDQHLSINKIHDILLDAALPSTIEDLKNPTEDYIVNLLTTFLSRFSIDVNLINQPIPDQHIVMSYYEDSDIINLINLHTVLTQIFDQIFLHDFCFTDITNPGQKRLKKHAKLLSNFVLYTMHKKPEFNDKNDQIEATLRLLEDLKERNAQVIELINNKAKHKTSQSSMIKKLDSDIQHILSQTEKINKKVLDLEALKNEAEKENQIAKEQYGSVKTAMGKLSKEIAELQSEVVYSPEEHQSSLDELKKQKKLKLEERDMIQEAIQEKKQSIKQIGEKLSFVPKMNEIFSTLTDVEKELINKKTKLNNIPKQIESLNNILKERQNKLAMHKDQMVIEKSKLQLQHEEDIAPLLNLYNQLLSEKKEQKAKFDTNQAYFNEKCLKKNKLQADIKKKEENISVLIHNWNKIYDNEITNELEAWT